MQTVVKQYVHSVSTQISELKKTLGFYTSCLSLLTVFSLSFKVSVLVNSDPEVHEIAYQYGRNVGIAFQVHSIVSA